MDQSFTFSSNKSQFEKFSRENMKNSKKIYNEQKNNLCESDILISKRETCNYDSSSIGDKESKFVSE